MKNIFFLIAAIALTGCVPHHYQLEKLKRPDLLVNPDGDIIIYSATNPFEAKAKAMSACKGNAYEIPSLRAIDEMDENIAPGFHFNCNEIEALRQNGKAGDLASQRRYEQLKKEQDAKEEKQRIQYYARLVEAAKTPGFATQSYKIPGGGTLVRTIGNGLICETEYSSGDVSSHCDKVN